MSKTKMSFEVARRFRSKAAAAAPNDKYILFDWLLVLQIVLFLLFIGGVKRAGAQADQPVVVPAQTASASDACRALFGLGPQSPAPNLPHQVLLPYVSFGELICDLFPQGTLALGRVGNQAVIALGESRGVVQAALYDVSSLPVVDASKINTEIDPEFLEAIFAYDGPLSGEWVLAGTYPIEPEIAASAQTPDPSQWLQYVVGEVIDMFSKDMESAIFVPVTSLANTEPSFNTSVPITSICPGVTGSYRFHVMVPVWLPQENTWMVLGTWTPSGLPLLCPAIYPYQWLVGPQVFNLIPADVREPLVKKAEQAARDYEIDLWALPSGSLVPELTPGVATYTVIGGAMIAYVITSQGGALPSFASTMLFTNEFQVQAATPDAEIGIVFWDLNGDHTQNNPSWEPGVPGVKVWGEGDPDTFTYSGSYGQWKLPTIAGEYLMCEYGGVAFRCRTSRDPFNVIEVSFPAPHESYLPLIK